MKNNFIVGFIVFALLGFTGIIFNSAAGSRVRAELAEERVEELKEERLLIEEQ